MSKKKPETLLATRVANYMMMEYPHTIYRFDLAADMPLPIVLAMRNKELHGKWTKGYPDMLICKVMKKYGGLYLELKATDEVPDTEHTRRQQVYHAALRKAGYKAMFVCGYDEAVHAIDTYLKQGG